MVTRIVLIRHGSTETGARLCGSLDIPLSPAGQQQLEALVGRPPSRPPDALFSSTLSRAREVATRVGRIWQLQPYAADWAREIHCGQVEGVRLDQLRRDFPELWARHEAQADETFAWPGGETYAQCRLRILAGLKATATAHVGGRVAVVTHAGVISQVLGVVRGRPASVWAADRPDPLAATEITWTNGAPGAVLAYNDPDWY